MQTFVSKRPTFKRVFQDALQLPLRDQRRLRDELAKLSGVKQEHPAVSRASVRAGRLLAGKVRKELENTANDSLEETIRQLRGRKW